MADECECTSTSGTMMAWEDQVLTEKCLGSTFVRISNKRLTKVKLKFTLEQATKAQRRSRGIAVLFL
jgi:hypothetical protein